MKPITILAACLLLPASALFAGEGKHLFILSGQSNMAGLDPAVSFTPAVTAAFGDRAPSVRRRAAELAGRRPGIALSALLDDQDDTVVEVAAWACGEQESVDDEVLTRLVDLATGSASALVREAAAAALGAIGDERGLPAILAACEDKPAVRRRAVLALAPFEGADVEAALERALTDRDWQVRQAAEDLRGATGQVDL